MTRGRIAYGRTAVMLIITLPFLYPFVFLIGTALKPLSEFNEDAVGLPSHPTTANLSHAWHEASLGPAMLHSLVAVGVGVAVTVALSVLSAFWFIRHRGRVATTLRWALIGAMAVPPPVFIVPLFIQLSDWGLTDNLFTLGLVFGAWNVSFGLYLIFAFFESLPREVLEAAAIDGASPRQLLVKVLVPLSKAALMTLAVLTFVWCWSDLLISIVLVQEPERRLLTPALATLADQYASDVPKSAAGVLIAIIPMLVVFLLGQRLLVRGILAGVGK